MMSEPRVEAVRFESGEETLHGVLTLPEQPGLIAVLVLVGGPQYRVGSHRQFVLLSRALAGAGHPVLRFDCRGMGDSSGRHPGFEQLTPDIGAAIDSLFGLVPGVEQVVLCALCDGASAALLYVHESNDPRVTGLCLVNPWVRSTTSHAQTQIRHYYRDRLGQRDFWIKLLLGKIAIAALRGLIGTIQAARKPLATTLETFRDRMTQGIATFRGAVLVVLSDNDYTAREFETFITPHPVWQQALSEANRSVVHIAEADHTFSDTRARLRMEQATAKWLHDTWGRRR